MSVRFRRSRTVVQCDVCPGRPVLPTPDAHADTRRCVRCQGQDRWLPLPHPDDHLCAVCRRECPGCRALTAEENTLCLDCRGRCRVCRGERPPRPVGEPVRIGVGERKDGTFRKYEKVYWPQTWDRDLCDACAAPPRHPLRAALAALPEKLIRACGGTAPRRAVETIEAELAFRTPVQLAERIERRWWGGWASRPLQRKSDGADEGYGPDDVAVWLVAPHPCRARCEDGWQPDDPGRLCPVCRGASARRLAERDDDEDGYPEQRAQREAAATGADRTVARAVAARPPQPECEGRGGTCGRPAAAGHTRCPACLGWPWCGCGRRRYDPSRNRECRNCREPELPPA